MGDRWLRKTLIADHRSGLLRGPVILVGHSCGGRYALYSAHQLARRGIPIELLLCIDVAMPYAVAANVRHAAHLYRSRRRIYPARPLRPAPGTTAQITNLDLDAAGSPIDPSWLNHLTITASTAVQAWVFNRILRAVHSPECPAARE